MGVSGSEDCLKLNIYIQGFLFWAESEIWFRPSSFALIFLGNGREIYRIIFSALFSAILSSDSPKLSWLKIFAELDQDFAWVSPIWAILVKNPEMFSYVEKVSWVGLS